VLLPLDLAPSQWEPLIPQLSAHYCMITLGGPALGVVSLLEGRGRSGYLGVVRMLLDAVRVRPGKIILEVGCGSGVVLRELARRTVGANPIIGIDINAYLRREVMRLAAREGLADRIIFQEGRAEGLPLETSSADIALSRTVMEDRMLTELVRVTRPGGRIGAIVRAMDMPWWTNLPLSPALRSKADRPRFFGDVTAGSCADASLYRHFHAAGLTELTCFPQLVAITSTFEPSRLADMEQRLLTTLTEEGAAEWREAVAPAKPAGTFFLASPHHCAVGTKPA
jgi:SAM-dependent methyltransferase